MSILKSTSGKVLFTFLKFRNNLYELSLSKPAALQLGVSEQEYDQFLYYVEGTNTWISKKGFITI